MTTGGSYEPSVPDSSHVGFLYRGVAYGRSFLTWYTIYGSALLLVLLLGAPLAGATIYEGGTYQPESPLQASLLLAALLLATFVALPVAIAAVLQWGRCVRALFRDVPRDSPWVATVLRPFRRRYWAAGAALVVAAALGFVVYAVAFYLSSQFNAGQYNASETPTVNGVLALVLLGSAWTQVAAQLLVAHAFSDLIAGSEIPAIDAARGRAVRIASWSTLALAAVGLIAAALAAYSFELGPTIGDLTALAIATPAGLVLGAVLLRRAYGSWLDLAYRLIGRREIV